MRRSIQRAMPAVAAVLAAVLIAAAAFTLGRATAPDAAHPAQDATVGAYLDGLRAGQAQGRREGRAEQEGAALPAGDRTPARDAFAAGYTAGMNDVFAVYDGGWTVGVPWIVTLESGAGSIDYRFSRRTAVAPGTDCYLCPDGHTLCSRPR